MRLEDGTLVHFGFRGEFERNSGKIVGYSILDTGTYYAIQIPSQIIIREKQDVRAVKQVEQELC